jgi:lysophospholipase L1-like esterase
MALVVLYAVAPASAQRVADDSRWVGTWATALVARAPAAQPAPAAGAMALNDQTLRQVVRISLGGEQVRVVVSNAFGTAPLEVGAAHVAIRDQNASILAPSGRVLTFDGRPAVTLAAGTVRVSDPVSLEVPSSADLAIDLYLPGDLTQSTSPLSGHTSALQTNFVSTGGDHTGEVAFPVARTMMSSLFLARVEVAASPRGAAVVAFGDSITDGTRSTPDTNNRWPDALGRRLVSAGIEVGVLNAGIAGNQVLANGAGMSALARFDRDVLVQGGVQAVIVLEGINDINLGRNNPSPSAEDIIAGYRQLIARAHSVGVKVFGGTLTPASLAGAPEAKRQAVNAFIRNSGEFDGVVDFDAAVRDPEQPARILARFNPGDNLHMNDAGYRAMGDAIDVGLLDFGAAGQ